MVRKTEQKSWSISL